MNNTRLTPMSARKSVAYFGIPWLLFLTTTYIIIPSLSRARVPLFLNFLVSLGIPLGLLGVAALVAYRRDGGAWSWKAFQCRFRLEAMPRSTWLWTLGLCVVMFLAPGFLSFSADFIRSITPIPDPLTRMFDINSSAFMGVPLKGAWWLVLGYFVYVLLNVFGEELWWRGYILPRQELSLGKWTWLVHGLLWDLFHSFFYWEILIWLPGCLALSYVAQRTKSTWPGIIAHLFYSVPTLIFLVAGVLR